MDDAEEVRMYHNHCFANIANKKHRGFAENDAMSNRLVSEVELSWIVSTELPT